MGRKPKTDPDALIHLAHDVLILHLFDLFNRVEEQTKQQKKRGKMRRRAIEVAGLGEIDPRTVESASKGHGIGLEKADQLADALSRKMHTLIEECGGSEKLLEEMKTSLAWSNPARAFQWLEDRIAGKPPYIHKGDLIVNRNDRHLIDEYEIALAVAPTPSGVMRIEYPDKDAVSFPHETLALLKYAVRFSPHNRNFQADFLLRYSTNQGMLEVVEPLPEDLKDPAGYRRNRKEAMVAPHPRSSESQRLSMLIYGGYDEPVLSATSST